MTYQEALSEITDWKNLAEQRGCNYECNAMLVYEKVISALEKQIPKKPKDILSNEVGRLKYGQCQRCGRGIFGEYDWCSKCGQKIDWGDEK